MKVSVVTRNCPRALGFIQWPPPGGDIGLTKVAP
jgi:hypothetical protein